MIVVVALILVAACAVVILGAVFGDPSEVVVLDFFDVVTAEVNSIGAFLIGLVTGAATLVSLWLLYAALRRSQRKASERRAMERRHDELEKEKRELEHKLGRDRAPEPALGTPEDPGRHDTYGLSTQPRQDPDPR